MSSRFNDNKANDDYYIYGYQDGKGDGVEKGIEKSICLLEEYKNNKFVDDYVVDECIKVLSEKLKRIQAEAEENEEYYKDYDEYDDYDDEDEDEDE